MTGEKPPVVACGGEVKSPSIIPCGFLEVCTKASNGGYEKRRGAAHCPLPR